MFPSDTIAALSSSAFPAPRAIVRLSGPATFSIASQLVADLPQAAGASGARLALGGMQISCTLYRFRAPRSYTGEDIIEFHIPGNPLLTQMLLEELFRHGARGAEPGEFTARAYFNGRLDLTQAEGVAAAVSSQSERESAAARRLLAGELTRRLEPIIDSVAQMLALTEVGIDFSEEDVSFIPPDQARSRIDAADAQLRGLLTESVRFERLAYEPTVVLAGRPNAGKSTLLNALAGRQRAVVSSVAGTTRDAIWSSVRLVRGIVRVTDVAGIDESQVEGDIDQQMRRHALRAIDSADVLVLVVDGTDDRPHVALSRRIDLFVHTKCDLHRRAGFIPPSLASQTNRRDESRPTEAMDALQVSAHSGEGLDALRDAIDRAAFGGDSDSSAALALNSRHVAAIETALDALSRARDTLTELAGDELIALELREALDALGSIAGQITPDDVLGRIFGSFCIGK